jgi:8-oxo-dGTP diphosphatase
MECFWCTIKEGEIILKEHEAAKWLAGDALEIMDWLLTDIGLVIKFIVNK